MCLSAYLALRTMSTVLGLANRFLTRDKGQSAREPTRNEGVGVSGPDNKECEEGGGYGPDVQKIEIASLEDEPPQPGILTLNEGDVPLVFSNVVK